MEKRRLSVEEDIRKASTLPAWATSDPECFAEIREKG